MEARRGDTAYSPWERLRARRRGGQGASQEASGPRRHRLRALAGEHLADRQADWSERTYYEAKRYLTDARYFGPLHRMPLDTIGLKDIAGRIVVIRRERGAATAARARSALSALFVWAMRRGLVTANPVINSDNPKTTARARVLTGDELVAIWKACANDHYGRIVKLLILTGCRRAECGDMAWSELDLERGVWTLPRERTKTGKARMIPLLPMLLDVLKDVPRMASRDRLFGERALDRGYTAWSKGKAALDRRSGVTDWVVHDLRRSVATCMAEELAVQPHVVELLLGHEFRTGVQGTYNRATYSREIRDAYLRWHDNLSTLLDGVPRKIIPLPYTAS